ncbi:MAG: cyclase family protein [Christensenellales bacterium]|jgi:arylformamidase
MVKYIDLTHVIDPGAVQRKFSIEQIGAETVNPNVVRLEDQWYIMSNINMVSHIGTHIEAPYHILPSGKDLAALPLETLCGDAVLLDLRGLPQKSAICEETVKAAAEKAGGIRKGDIVLCNLGYADHYGADEYSMSPHFTTEAIEFLANSGMKMMGVDAGGVEIPASEEHVNHLALLSRDIPLIENVANLNALPAHRFKVYAFPIAVLGLESFPVRVVAQLG